MTFKLAVKPSAFETILFVDGVSRFQTHLTGFATISEKGVNTPTRSRLFSSSPVRGFEADSGAEGSSNAAS